MGSEKTILDEFAEYFNFKKPDGKNDLTKISEYTEIDYKSLRNWETAKKVSPIGTIALKSILERAKDKEKNKHLEDIDNLLTKIIKSKNLQ